MADANWMATGAAGPDSKQSRAMGSEETLGSAGTMATKGVKGYLLEILQLRGIAILCIVGAHAWSFLTYFAGGASAFNGHRYLYAVTETLFHGSTLLFALISGLLFSAVLHAKGWRRFYQQKLKFVLLPYLCISFVSTLWQQAAQPLTFTALLSQLLIDLWHGSAQVHFWYMPVLFGLFLLTPLLAYWQGLRWQWPLWLLAALPLLLSRTTYPDFLSWASFGYFCGAYAAGILLGSLLQPLFGLSKKWLWCSGGLTLVCSMVILCSFLLEYRPTSGINWQQSLVYLQKVSMFIWLLLLCHQRYGISPATTTANSAAATASINKGVATIAAKHSLFSRILQQLGQEAFAIYFLHLSFIMLLAQIYISWFGPLHLMQLWLGGIVIYGCAILASMCCCRILQRLLGQKSRYLIGA